MDWQTIAEKLWQLLDDIDTLSDVHKPEQNEYYKAVMKKANKRHTLLSCFDGKTLTRPHIEAEKEKHALNLYLYKVYLSAMSNSYGISYVIAENPSAAYDIVRNFCNKKDLGFAKERALDRIELLAETNFNGELKQLLHITTLLKEVGE
jgi:hypothetical protein